MRPARCIAFIVALATLLLTLPAFAEKWQPPALRGHVMDTAGALSAPEATRLDAKLDAARRRTGFAVVVYLLPSLPEGMGIEDVGYIAGNAWGVGSEKGDDGVLLIASLGDRKLRIETGKGVGGALTDIRSSEINRTIVGPLLREGHVYEALDKGTDAILRDLVEGTPGGASEEGRTGATRGPPGGAGGQETAPLTLKQKLIGGGLVIAFFILMAVSPGFRQIVFWFILSGIFRGGRGGGGGGGGYGGGGGSFGGGGSSDDY